MNESLVKSPRHRRVTRCDRLRGGKRIANLVLAAIIVLAVMDSGRPAYAYLDPGTGSIILQMLLGGVAGVLVVAKLYWHQFTALFKRKQNDAGTVPDSRPE